MDINGAILELKASLDKVSHKPIDIEHIFNFFPDYADIDKKPDYDNKISQVFISSELLSLDEQDNWDYISDSIIQSIKEMIYMIKMQMEYGVYREIKTIGYLFNACDRLLVVTPPRFRFRPSIITEKGIPIGIKGYEIRAEYWGESNAEYLKENADIGIDIKKRIRNILDSQERVLTWMEDEDS